MPPVTGFTGGDSLDVLKPDPRMLAPRRRPAAARPADPDVGDSEIDAATAANAGVPFLLHTRRLPPRSRLPASPPPAAFADFAALPGLVARPRSPRHA